MASNFDNLPRPPLSSYESAIKYSSSRSIHEPSARAVILGDDIFYSPNSSTVPAPPPPPKTEYIRDTIKDSVDEFHHPHWWNTNAGYLPFLLTHPNFRSPPFHTLFNNPLETGHRHKRRVQMDSSDILNWNRLEHNLSQIFKSFQSRYSIPDMPPIVRTSLVCQEAFKYPSQFIAAEKRCRNWFSVWMAMVSLGIAVGEITDGDTGSDGLPLWYQSFARYNSEDILCGIRQQLGQFNPFHPRAGVFLDWAAPSSKNQPSVDFFVRLGIPVWYPWGATEEYRAQQNPRFYEKYILPAHLLQAAKTFLTKPISAPPPSASDEAQRPWVEFFAARERRATGPMPTKKPSRKVFHWEKDLNGSWGRVQVVRRLQIETLAEYGERQKKFDKRTNEWDCCTEMGDLDASERQAMDWDPDEPIIAAEWVPVRPGSIGSTPAQEGLAGDADLNGADLPGGVRDATLPIEDAPFSSPSRDLAHAPDEHSPADILRLFFGFVPPPPSAQVALLPPTERQVNDLALGIGYANAEAINDYAQTQVGKAAANFFWSMSQSTWVPPHNILFDLASGNPRSLKFSRRLQFMHELPGNAYLFDFRGESTLEWKIAVTDVTDALFIMRLDEAFSDYEIARELLSRGIAFYTLVRTPRFAVEPPLPVFHLFRMSSYQFSRADYDSYCHARDEMLCNPRIARQALKVGGIIWRLAMDRASFQDVLTGPTTMATLRHCCKSFSTERDAFWIDDALHPNEIELLSGVYHVYTGQGDQTALRSWWPPMDLWNAIVKQSFWNERSETFYKKRLEELASGEAVPLTSTQWRSSVKSNSAVRRAVINNTAVSTSFLRGMDIIR